MEVRVAEDCLNSKTLKFLFTKIFTRFWISHDSWSEVKLLAVIRIAKGWPATSAWSANHIWGFRIPGPLRCFRKKRCLEVLIFGILRYTCIWYMEIVFWIFLLTLGRSPSQRKKPNKESWTWNANATTWKLSSKECKRN